MVNLFDVVGQDNDDVIQNKGWIQSTPISDKIAQNRRQEAIAQAMKENAFNDIDYRDFAPKNASMNEFDEMLRPKSLCDVTYLYRTITGDCNNLQETSRGAAGIAMRRIAPPAYSDGDFINFFLLQSFNFRQVYAKVLFY